MSKKGKVTFFVLEDGLQSISRHFAPPPSSTLNLINNITSSPLFMFCELLLLPRIWSRGLQQYRGAILMQNIYWCQKRSTYNIETFYFIWCVTEWLYDSFFGRSSLFLGLKSNLELDSAVENLEGVRYGIEWGITHEQGIYNLAGNLGNGPHMTVDSAFQQFKNKDKVSKYQW